MAQSAQFIIRKNDLVLYLREFIKSLQNNSYAIERILLGVTEETEKYNIRKSIRGTEKSYKNRQIR